MEQFTDYSNATVHDLLADDSFIRWVRRPTPEQDLHWKNVQQTYPGIVRVIKDARQLTLLLTIQEDVAPVEKKARALSRFRDAVVQVSPQNEQTRQLPSKQRTMSVWRVAATVVLLMVAGVGAWYYVNQPGAETGGSDRLQALASATTHTTLLMGDNTPVLLDEQPIGMKRIYGPLSVMKTDSSQLEFALSEAGAVHKDPGLWADLAVPAGKQYEVKLPDGSSIRLNARSAVRFAPGSADGLRRASVSGEAFFDIQHDPNRPFVVVSDVLTVEVLGTAFNVSNQGRNGASVVTLASGAVRVSSAHAEPVQLKPGQQVVFGPDESRPEVKTVRVEDELAWTNGIFSFRAEPVGQVMQRLSRWYDIDVIYEGTKPDVLFSGTFPLTTDLPDVLSILEQAGGVHFVVAGRQVKVYADH